ncbi:MAG: energy-coupling factor ABC transporter permease [Firmicutes bacterium]|nr:energy-coupling factor ABC transporter permease [Bacillota bacterium]
MHMADALLAPAVAATMYVASGTAAGISISKLKKDDEASKLPVMAVTSALVFAGQMINYTIPGTGSSGHMCGGMLLSALLGPQAGFLSMIVILAIQCLFFADGGLMALGANCWNMAFYGCFVGYYLIWRPIMKSKWFGSDKNAQRLRIIAASIIGCVLTLQLGAFSVVLETSLSGITELPFGAFCALMQPIHLAIGLVEGLITAAVLVFVYQSRPELLQCVDPADGEGAKASLRSVVAILAAVALVVGGGLSLLASSNPDGLEWALFGNAEEGYAENMGLDEDDFGVQSSAADAAGSIQEKTSFLPDYAFPDSEAAVGTTVSGIVGSAIVAGVAVLICFAGGFFRKKQKNV